MHFSNCLLVVFASGFLVSGAGAQTQDDTGTELDHFALATFDRVQPLSIRDNVEYCGLLGNDAEGVLTATPPVRGELDSCQPAEAPEGFEVLASYHTHGAWTFDADTEVPSEDDLRGDFEENIDGYVATPAGRVWLVSVEERVAYVICGPGCVTADPKFRRCDALPPGDEYTLETLRARELADTGEC